MPGGDRQLRVQRRPRDQRHRQLLPGGRPRQRNDHYGRMQPRYAMSRNIYMHVHVRVHIVWHGLRHSVVYFKTRLGKILLKCIRDKIQILINGVMRTI